MSEFYDLIRYQIVPPAFLLFFTIVTQVSKICYLIVHTYLTNLFFECQIISVIVAFRKFKYLIVKLVVDFI